MTLNKLTEPQLHQAAYTQSQTIHRQTFNLIELLKEIDTRKSFVDLGYSSLFTYIVEELHFSESQAAVYNSIIRTRLTEITTVRKMLAKNEVTISTLGLACQFIRQHKSKFKTPKQKEQFIHQIKDLPRDEIRAMIGSIKNPQNTPAAVVIHSHVLKAKLQKIKKNLQTPNMSDEEVISYMANKELYHGQDIKPNKTITPKTREILLKQAKHRCQFTYKTGKRCMRTNHLEVEHIIPKGKGGSNHPANLRILCKTHNLRNAYLEYGNLRF